MISRFAPWYKGYTNSKQKRNDAHHQERVERYHKVHELRAQGAEVTLIAHQTGLSRQSVYAYLKMEHPPERKRGKPGKSVIEPYKEYIIKRWNQGVRNAQQVYRELKEMGYPGGDSAHSALLCLVSQSEGFSEIQAG